MLYTTYYAFPASIQEIKELQSQIQNAMVTVEMDNNRELEMKNIIDEVKEQYKTMITKSRDETQQWYKNKVTGSLISLYPHHESIICTPANIGKGQSYFATSFILI